MTQHLALRERSGSVNTRPYPEIVTELRGAYEDVSPAAQKFRRNYVSTARLYRCESCNHSPYEHDGVTSYCLFSPGTRYTSDMIQRNFNGSWTGLREYVGVE